MNTGVGVCWNGVGAGTRTGVAEAADAGILRPRCADDPAGVAGAPSKRHVFPRVLQLVHGSGRSQRSLRVLQKSHEVCPRRPGRCRVLDADMVVSCVQKRSGMNEKFRGAAGVKGNTRTEFLHRRGDASLS